MHTESRTKKSIKNSIVALSFYTVNLILQFFSRKIFLDYLGTEILGLNTTATNLLQFLNLAELGIGAAIAFTLYQPLFNDDKNAINEILTLQGWYYKRIGFFVLGGSAVLMCFFPWIFSKIELPLWYAYASYSVILLSALLSYFFNYRQILLSADQQDYKIQYSYKSVMLVKVALQMIAIKYFPYPYISWLVLEGLFAIIATFSLNKMIDKTYPFLCIVTSPIKELKKRHNNLTKKIGQVFYHKIGGFALTQSSPLIIYAFANLTLVTIYGNYQIIVIAITSLMTSFFNSMSGGVGNLVASKDQNRIAQVFQELFSIRFLLVTTFCIGFYILSPTILYLWIGKKYILPNSTVLLIICNMFFTINRATVDNYIAAYGLYGDIYSPLAEATLNIGLSILFGYYWGLNGILFGVFISLFLVIFCWKPYYLFKKGFNESFFKYLRILIKNVVSAGVSIALVLLISRKVSYSYCNSINGIASMILLLFLYFFGCLALQVLFNTGLLSFIKRIINLIIK